jgi:hypothetical protein
MNSFYSGISWYNQLFSPLFYEENPYLIHDLLRHLKKNPNVPPIYMVEVFTKPNVEREAGKNYVFDETGMIPAIYDKGTHYVTNHKLTLEILKEISDTEILRTIMTTATSCIEKENKPYFLNI